MCTYICIFFYPWTDCGPLHLSFRISSLMSQLERKSFLSKAQLGDEKYQQAILNAEERRTEEYDNLCLLFRHQVTDLVNRTGEEFFLSKAQWRIRLMESLNRNLEGGGTWLVMVELDIRSECVTIMVFVLGHRIKQLICWRWFIPTPKIFNLVRLKFPISRCIKQNDLVRVQIFCIH